MVFQDLHVSRLQSGQCQLAGHPGRALLHDPGHAALPGPDAAGHHPHPLHFLRTCNRIGLYSIHRDPDERADLHRQLVKMATAGQFKLQRHMAFEFHR